MAKAHADPDRREPRRNIMADIDVQRTGGPVIWPWILGLLLLALLAWLAFSMMGRDDRPVGMATDTPTVATETAPAAAALPAAAEAFMRDCHLEEGTRAEGMGMEHEFTVQCLEQLAGSLEGLAQQRPGDPNIQQYTQTIRDRAQQIRDSPDTSLQHANWTREAAMAGANALEAMHGTWHAGDAQVQSSVAQTRQAAEQIRPTEQHLEQLSDLRSYFRSAGDAIQQMAQRQPA
jgi:hypothetical protein